mmetsp:Transcript_13754/g.39127  ORF Transcript_13754/g.39127 Transcript_13754/m.39127 type:complete len:141 (+) Transcript_13754:40-462(+)|eukprot:CAMPEP_0119130880 /NCGR_PEP_ID=MMETSP1310-20130426/9017_1 /TAXON_ID=464262 /ORGANISM="Genus nov. species nov., Strain RCC2339" /LENGTH=140 /DNA_ID=CAMNT_0007121419 /DNA_START=40 /DNA_END=462 /DNA_ORIENTATION=-
MATTTCTIPDEIEQAYKKFKVRKNPANCALVFKINKKDLTVELDETLDDVTMDDLAMEMPDTVPRFVVYSYKYTWDDGRVSYPLFMIFWCPPGINNVLNMLYASTKPPLVQKLGVTKVFDIRNPDDFNEEWLKKKLSFFK